ncbi:MAG: transposase, partial [Lentisphaeraceae bacterium]|nr:transposase [Lentisphaeraceae bacterium]
MRMQREFFKPRNDGVYLHVYNHTVSMFNDMLPLGDFEKTKFIQTFERYKVKYNIELISLVVMGNHFHALVYCPPEKFTQEEAFNAYNKFHRKEKSKFRDDFRVKALQQNSNNISELMREVQREFSLWFNKTRPYKRKGALWQDRFQCQLIQSDAYLWGCLKYIEMNPVRAGISKTAEDYSFSSFGRWKERHPYEKNFTEHILSLSGKDIEIQAFKEYMSNQMKIMTLQDEAKYSLNSGNIEQTKYLSEVILFERNKEEAVIDLFSQEVVFSQRIIGSDDFIKEKYRQWNLYKNSA